MSVTFSTYLSCLSIGLAVFLFFALFRFIYREKYAQAFLKLPESRFERVIWYENVYVKVFKILWLPALILSVLLPSTSFFLFHEPFLPSAVCMVLFFIMTMQEYLFRRWFINYLKTRRSSQ